MASGELGKLAWLRSAIYEDYIANKRQWSNPGFHALVVHRFGVWAQNQKGLARRLFSIVYVLFYVLTRNFYAIEIHRNVTIGRRLWIPHATGIVIHQDATIGDDCMIRQGVTIGRAGVESRRSRITPTVGDNVEVGAGAAILGGVAIGNGARIGPNAVVMTDVPAGRTVFAAPARVMKSLSEARRNDETT